MSTTTHVVAKSCFLLIGLILGLFAGFAAIAFLLWWLVPVATAGAVTVGFWQVFAGVVVVYTALRVVAVGIKGFKVKETK